MVYREKEKAKVWKKGPVEKNIGFKDRVTRLDANW